jgi:hypothetical protein
MSNRAGQGDVPKRRRTMNPVELEKRATDQFGRVEAQTIEIARQIFTAKSG